MVEERDLKSIQILKQTNIKSIKLAFNNTLPEFAARTGLNNSNSKYVIFMGDDDYFNLNTDKEIENLKFIFDDLKKNNYPWAIAQSSYVNSNDKKNRILMTLIKKFLLKKYSKYLISIVNFIMTPGVFIRKDLVIDETYFDPNFRYSQDYFTWFKFSRKFKPKIYDYEISRVTFGDYSISGSFNFSRYIVYFKYISSRTNNLITNFFQFIFVFYIATHNFIKKDLIWKRKNKFIIYPDDKKKIKILHLTRFFDTDFLGGIERGIINSNILAKEFNVQNDILTTTTKANDTYLKYEGMNVYFSKENISIQNNVISFDFLRKF